MNQKTNTPNQKPDQKPSTNPKKAEAATDKASDKNFNQAEKSNPAKVDAKKNGANNANKPIPKKQKSSGKGLQYLLLLLIIILAVAAWFIHDQTKQQIANLEQQLQQQHSQNTLAVNQSKQALDALNNQNELIESLNKSIAQSRNDFNSLNKSFQLVADRGSDLILLNDIEHLATIAQQQLHLSGNVANAIISLETAQAQLSVVSKPEFASLLQTINGDLDRLRTASTIDVSILSGSLDELAGLILQAPLLVPDYAVPELDSKLNQKDSNNDNSFTTETDVASPTASTSTTNDGEWWKDWASKAWGWSVDTASTIKYDLNQFVSVRRVDDASALLISPDQAARFRDNLRLRIMTAQLALMMGHSQIWHTETEAVLDAIQTRFDKDSSITRKAIKIARQVADAEIEVEIPTVNNTVNAIKTIRESDMDKLNASQQ